MQVPVIEWLHQLLTMINFEDQQMEGSQYDRERKNAGRTAL